MPTASDHRAEASSLADVLETIRSVRAGLVADRGDVGVRGPVGHLVEAAIEASTGDLDELGRLVAALVDELHRRAALCDQYTGELRRHQDDHRRWAEAVQHSRATAHTASAMPWPGPEPLPPSAPFPGAVAG